MAADNYYFIASGLSIIGVIVSLIGLIASFLSLKKQIKISNLREYWKSYREILEKLPLEFFKKEIPINMRSQTMDS